MVKGTLFVKQDNPKTKRKFDLNNISERDLETYGWVRFEQPKAPKNNPTPSPKEPSPDKPEEKAAEDEPELPNMESKPEPKKPAPKRGRKPSTKSKTTTK